MLDKTGTLTEGRPQVTHLTVVPTEMDESHVIALVSSLEAASEHPLADALVREGERRGVPRLPVSTFTSIAGQGVQGDVDGHLVIVGNAMLLRSHAVEVGAPRPQLPSGRRRARRQSTWPWTGG